MAEALDLVLWGEFRGAECLERRQVNRWAHQFLVLVGGSRATASASLGSPLTARPAPLPFPGRAAGEPG